MSESMKRQIVRANRIVKCIDEAHTSDGTVIESLRQQLDDTQRLLAESQALAIKCRGDVASYIAMEQGDDESANYVSRTTIDSTALDAAIAKAKREARLSTLMDAVDVCNWLGNSAGTTTASCAMELRRMADELKGGEQ